MHGLKDLWVDYEILGTFHRPSPNPTYCPMEEVSVSDGIGEG